MHRKTEALIKSMIKACKVNLDEHHKYKPISKWEAGYEEGVKNILRTRIEALELILSCEEDYLTRTPSPSDVPASDDPEQTATPEATSGD
jgi:hypothetical protein